MSENKITKSPEPIELDSGEVTVATMQTKLELLRNEVKSLKDERSKLHDVVIQKDSDIQILSERNDREKSFLEHALQKEKKNVADLVSLLEGVSTNSDQLPTGQVYHTMNAPLDSYLLKRTASNDSIREMEELQSDQEGPVDVANESAADTSFCEQMNHTVAKYEDQIKQLQILYDQDVEALEKERDELKRELVSMRRQLKSSDSSSKLADLNVEETERTYQRRLSDAKKEHQQILHQTKKEAEENIKALLEENEKLSKLANTTEEKYMTIIESMRNEFLSLSSHEAKHKVNDVLGKLEISLSL